MDCRLAEHIQYAKIALFVKNVAIYGVKISAISKIQQP